MLVTTSYTTNTSQKIGTVIRRRDASYFIGTILIYGTFSAGTMAFFLSPDNGTTKVALKDATNASITVTADSNINIQLGDSSTNSDTLTIWATLTGAGTPSITVKFYDNR